MESAEKKRKLYEDRTELVVKSNDLIRNTRYELTEQEQKLIIFLISKISKDETAIPTIQVRLREYCEVAGIEYSGGAISHIKKNIQEIADKSWWIPIKNQKQKLFRWIDTAEIDGETVEISLSQSLTPYLVELRKDFTKYSLMDVLVLRGKYTIRLYELFRSYLWQGYWIVDVDELRSIINCDSYNAFKEFNRNVLKYSIDEINGYTGLFITYETIKFGRSVKQIKFKISEKMGWQNGVVVSHNISKRIKNG
jgi:plasmid replication initiation protein